MPDWTRYIKEKLPTDLFRGEAEGEILEELAAHLDDAFAEAMSRGATAAEAEKYALAEIQDWDALAQDILRTRGGSKVPRATRTLEGAETKLRSRGGPWRVLAALSQELRYSVRRLRKAPGFSLVILLTLAVGIGSTTAIFSVVKGILLDPLPFEDPHQLVAIWNTAPGMGQERLPQSLGINAVYEDESRALEEVGLWFPHTARILSDGVPEEITSIAVTDGTLRALRVQPVQGRLFNREDTQNGSPATILLSNRYWRKHLGADPDVLNQTLVINDSPQQVVGIMPAGFRIMGRDPDIYMPLYHNRNALVLNNFIYSSLGRLKEGVTPEQAIPDLERLIPLAAERYPGGMTLEQLQGAGAGVRMGLLKDELVGGVGRILWVVLGGVGIILLVAAANVANLLLVRAESRERDRAIQLAMGSPRSRIVGEHLMESGLLALLGGALGLVLARVGLRLIQSTGSGDLPRLNELGIDGGVFLFALGISLLTGLFLAILPALRSRGLDLVGTLKEGGRGSSSGRRRGRIRDGLVVGQLAMALVLLIGSGLMIRSFVSLRSAEPGFTDPEEILTFRLLIGSLSVQDAAHVPEAHAQLAQRISELSGVTSVGLSNSVPMDGQAYFDPIFFEDFPLPEDQSPGIRRFKRVGGNYVETMGNRLVAGRTISWDDVRNRARVVMITEGMARESWGDPARAVGRRIGTGREPGNWREVVGVVGDVRDDGMEKEPVEIVYWPMIIEDYFESSLVVSRTMAYAVRSPRARTPELLAEVRALVREAYPTRALSGITTMDEIQRASMARTSFTLLMLGIAAAVGLLLGSIGVYGVVSYTVGQRTQEMGVRIAMGAEAGRVIGMVLGKGMVLSVAGVALGIAVAVAVTRLMASLLFGVSPVDPLTYAVVSVVLMGVTLMASYLPARRAAAVDPMVALRAE